MDFNFLLVTFGINLVLVEPIVSVLLYFHSWSPVKTYENTDSRGIEYTVFTIPVPKSDSSASGPTSVLLS